jgi:hypothetical protein
MTAPAAANAIMTPRISARISGCLPMNRNPSRSSSHALGPSGASRDRRRAVSPVRIRAMSGAERMNEAALSQIGSATGRSSRNGIVPDSGPASPSEAANTMPASGSVP